LFIVLFPLNDVCMILCVVR